MRLWNCIFVLNLNLAIFRSVCVCVQCFPALSAIQNWKCTVGWLNQNKLCCVIYFPLRIWICLNAIYLSVAFVHFHYSPIMGKAEEAIDNWRSHNKIHSVYWNQLEILICSPHRCAMNLKFRPMHAFNLDLNMAFMHFANKLFIRHFTFACVCVRAIRLNVQHFPSTRMWTCLEIDSYAKAGENSFAFERVQIQMFTL